MECGCKLQQRLPFTVLKPVKTRRRQYRVYVATALTVYGIETAEYCFSDVSISIVATALTVYGIETQTFFKE